MTGLPHKVGPSSVIGSGLFGLVTCGMYDNPLAAYREYIQNSTDAIAGMSDTNEGKVEITIDPSKREVKIWDNGPGLSYDDALRQLVPIGRSNKLMGRDRGFRGIGRLAGLAFAETVIFTTRARPDEQVTRVTWNSRNLPRSAATVKQIKDVVQDCVVIDSLSGTGYPAHFFEVEVGGVARHAAGSLLNREAVRRYVSETCPVPISTVFPYFQRIESLFETYEPPMSLDITLDGNPEPVSRPYGKTIQFSPNREDDFGEFEEILIPSVDRTRDAAVGWIAHSSYLGAIPKKLQIRGIRARVGNIQIGDEAVFDSLYSEERFSRWCVGEIHILDPRIVPNARRDYFEPGPHLRNLENNLRTTLRKIATRCRTASTARNKDRKILSLISEIEDTYDLAISGYLSTEYTTLLVKEALEQIQSVREKVQESHLESDSVARLEMVETQLKDFNGKPNCFPFKDMVPSDVGVYLKVFQALAEASPSPRTAKELMEAMLQSNAVTQTNDM